jgi:hypothetical protein
MDYSALVNDVVMDCPGLPVPVAIRAIREAARRFCEESTAYRKKLTPATDLSYAAGVYTIAIPANTQLISVISPIVFQGSYTVDSIEYALDAISLQAASPEWLDMNRPGWRTDTDTDSVEYFCLQSTNTFVLTPDSGTDRKANLTVSLILMPDRTTTTLDDEFGNRWFDDLTAGAKSLLMIMPNVKWSNPQLAEYYRLKFDSGIDKARRYAETGFRKPQADGRRHVRSYYR